MENRIVPSILSADFGRLQEEVDKVKSADALQVDVMDGHFVPNLSIGPGVQASIKTDLLIETHLMVTNPDMYIKPFADAGSKRIIVHLETLKDADSTFQKIRDAGCEVGLALNPETPVKKAGPLLDKTDMVLLMTVNPGFGGQEFIDDVLSKIRELRMTYKKDIEVDGGIDAMNAKLCQEAGANMFVAGSFIFNNKKGMTPQDAITSLRESLPQD